MTNGWVDIKNTDLMLIMGGNPAENHPCGFKWAIEAKRNRNAKMIVVDPRFTRTASVADLFCQIRAGSDIAFLGGLIRYAIESNRIAKDYLLNYKNAAVVVKDGFKLPEDGLYSDLNRYCFSWRPHSLRDRKQAHRQGLPSELHKRRVRGEGRIQAARRRALFRVRCRNANVRQVHLEL